ncbi:archease [Microbispora sp. H13382]|uniref:archease n=1 Tax=Microbispora sp. H13382 TaxID=2729112 RepID=UPI001C7220AE|nr:archease [Microbispora sp. H13382]
MARPDGGKDPISGRGHRSLPHTADVRLEAWAPTVAECVAEAVRAVIGGFADLSRAERHSTRTLHVGPAPPEEQLLTVLDEVIYQMDTAARVPCEIEAHEDEAGLWLTLGMTDVAAVPQIGAVPKAVALHGLRFDHGPHGWVCTVTLDV